MEEKRERRFQRGHVKRSNRTSINVFVRSYFEELSRVKLKRFVRSKRAPRKRGRE